MKPPAAWSACSKQSFIGKLRRRWYEEALEAMEDGQ